MAEQKIYTESIAIAQPSRLRDYMQFIKLRLNLLVVFSTFIGFLIAGVNPVNWVHLFIICVGGFLTVGAANGINQIIEKESDSLMKRTENRPLVQGRISITEAVIASLIMGVAGVSMIGYFIGGLCALLSLAALILYAFAYTPLKKITPLSVHIGAIPGAMPAMIGYAAATGYVDGMAWALFLIQVIWQFPHFYAIAWILDDDYKRAGLKMMPLFSEKDKKGALQIVLFTSLLIPMSLICLLLGFTGIIATICLLIISAYFFKQSLDLMKDLSNASAKKLMFGSFLYLPLAFIIILIDKLI